MDSLQDGPHRVETSRDRALPWLLLLFIGSGCAALIFEVVWLQLLQLVIGSSAVSLGVLLGTFMGGMCLGSLFLPRMISARRHPLRVYAFLELGIGAMGIGMLWLIPYVGRVYSEQVGHGLPGILLRGVVCAVCLLAPTFLMGATLPALARWTETTPRGISWMGYFYGANIAGAVAGCLVAGFYLLRVHDVMIASYAAAALNAVVAIGGLILSFAAPYVPTAPASRGDGETELPAEPRSWTPYVAIALSGACAMGAEVVWTRLLGLMIGATVYTFSITLAVFLVGLGIGSSLGSSFARTTTRLRVLLGGCQFLAAAGVAWTAYMLSASIPNWPIHPTLSVSPWLDFQLDIVRCTWAVLPPTILWGASFPLALAAAARKGQDSAKLVGGVYAANTVGAIVGSIAASMIMVSWLGSQNTQRVLIAIAALAAVVCLVPLLYGPASTATSTRTGGFAKAVNIITIAGILVVLGILVTNVAKAWPASDRIYFESASDDAQPPFWARIGQNFSQSISLRDLLIFCALAAVLMLAPPLFGGGIGATRARALARVLGGVALTVVLIWKVPPRNDLLVAHGRMLPMFRNDSKVIYAREGMNSSVAVTEDGTGRYFHVSGKVEASTMPQDMRLQRMLGHIPAMLHKKPKSVLIVGCGAGVTAGSFIVHPDVERIVLCEIEPLIPTVVSTYFSKQNHDLINDKRLEIVYDDARHYIATTRETFDIITSDPIHPWVKGSATLYSQEYLNLCKQRLNPGGIVTQWVPLYQSTEAVVKSELATFFTVFPEGTIFANDSDGQGYDVVLLGQRDPEKFDLDEIQQRLERPEYARAAESLREVGFRTGLTLLATYAGYAPDLREWLKDAEINRDKSLRLQYLAGFGLNLYREDDIYKTILQYRKTPDLLLTGSDELRISLKQVLGYHGIEP